jgi:hypothetical protein
LKNLKTRKFFAVTAERPIFRMSTGTRAVGYPYNGVWRLAFVA